MQSPVPGPRQFVPDLVAKDDGSAAPHEHAANIPNTPSDPSRDNKGDGKGADKAKQSDGPAQPQSRPRKLP